MWTRHCGFLFARDLPGWVANCPRLESSVVNIHDCLRQIELVLACYKLIVPTLSSQRAGTCWAKCALVVEACQRRGGEGGRGQQQGGGACRQDIEQACCGGGGATFQVWVRLSFKTRLWDDSSCDQALPAQGLICQSGKLPGFRSSQNCTDLNNAWPP